MEHVPTPRTSARIIATLFTVSGVIHLVKPSVFRPLIPGWLPGADPIIIASGVAELGCAAGLLYPRTRPLTAKVSAWLLIAVFPGNVQMAVDAMQGDNAAFKAVSLARLPLQLPLIWLALRAGKSAQRTASEVGGD